MTTPEQSPLGQPTHYRERYDASLLCPIERAPGRAAIGVLAAPPFFGADIWNAYELSWLNLRGKPQIALLQAIVPADSPCMVESKSFKLYLTSFSQSAFDSSEAVRARIQQDVSAVCQAAVQVRITLPEHFGALALGELGGLSLDRLDMEMDVYRPEPALLKASFDEAPVEETLVSNLLKSNCPVTGQPDWASIQIRYVGVPIDHAGLLAYIVSYREHAGFHEQCVEQIFVDILERCKPSKLAIDARYTRRGGLDINPLRTNFNVPRPQLERTARQ